MPHVYNIPPGVSFVDALARGMLQRFGGDPLELARATVLLPTRRAGRALQEAFLRATKGRALLLPRLLPLGDLDADELLLAGEDAEIGAAGIADLPPAMPPLKRQLLLSRLIRHWGEVRGEPPSEDQAVRLAGALARLLDQVETEGLSFDRLAELVPEDYAAHWQITLEFLGILAHEWPAIERAEGCIGPAARRRLLLEAQAEAWRRAPPEAPVIAAGSTGSIPATAALIGVVAGLPRGMVVLPGLDLEADEETWAAIEEDPAHPQHGLGLLLARIGIPRDRVRPWPYVGVPETPAARARIVNAALMPAAATARWREFADAAAPERLAQALKGVKRIDCPGPGEEAAVVALLLRRALNRKGRRAALVTPDRALARRVAAELERWGIAVDDSAGIPLSHSPPGSFLRLTAEMAAGDLAPLPLLAALKHPLAAGGGNPAAFRGRVRDLERAVLRGPRPAPGFAGLHEALRAVGQPDGLAAWLNGLERMAAPFVAALERGATLGGIVDAHIGFAEALAATTEASGAARLWAGDAGEAAADFIAELRQAAADAPALKGERYPAVLSALLAGRVVRPRYGGHPRLSIWGPLEARLQHVDVVVLGGLNEGTWPAEVDPGPWLSRPMCGDFGLPLPERRIGLSAHDFAQAFCASRVYLTRATRVEGAPSVPSRWLLRLDALLQALGLSAALVAEGPQWLAWAAALDRPAETVPARPPAPRPPLEARPRQLSVTGVETWMRDPYDLYAKEILELSPLDPIDADPGAAERGILVHEALEIFLKRYPESLPDDPEAALLEIGRQVFRRFRAIPGIWAFWWPRYKRIARWFAEADRARRAEIARSFGEVRGKLDLDTPRRAFTLTAKADRIDLLADGALAILDYKTGALPRRKDVDLGIAPQLPLEAAIALDGGFPGVEAQSVKRLEYWRLTGAERAGEKELVKGDPDVHAARALDRLRTLVAAFDDPATPYHALPRPEWARRFSDYAHLARVKEWAAGGTGAEAE
ncbi:MAG: double-strand break repair protein AddB [Kiloniellaceae bacterium]